MPAPQYKPSNDIKKLITHPNEAINKNSATFTFGPELRSLVKEMEENGQGELVLASAIPRFNVIPTGIFPLDLLLGGGWPEGNPTMLFGDANSGKTTGFLKAIAGLHKKYPEHLCVLADVETSFDPQWAMHNGVDLDRLLIFRPKSGEEMADVMLGLSKVDQVSGQFLDSIPTVVPSKDYDDSLSDAVIGTRARLLGRLSSNLLQSIGIERQRRTALNPYGHWVTWFSSNAWRDKITMFGDPRTLPGGRWQHTFHNVKVELKSLENLASLSGKDIKEDEDGNPIVKEKKSKAKGGSGTDVQYTENEFKIWKAKIPGMRNGQYSMNLNPKDTYYALSEIRDAEVVAGWAKRLGILKQSGKFVWSDVFDYRFTSKEEVLQRILTDAYFANWLRMATIVKQRIYLQMPPLTPDGYMVSMDPLARYTLDERAPVKELLYSLSTLNEDGSSIYDAQEEALAHADYNELEVEIPVEVPTWDEPELPAVNTSTVPNKTLLFGPKKPQGPVVDVNEVKVSPAPFAGLQKANGKAAPLFTFNKQPTD